jgi:hypothetical protein
MYIVINSLFLLGFFLGVSRSPLALASGGARRGRGVVGADSGAASEVVAAVEHWWVVFAADVTSLAAVGRRATVVVGVAAGSDWWTANVSTDVVQILAAATVRHAFGRGDPVLNTVANQKNLNFLRSSAGGGGRWASWRNGAVDAGFARPEIGIVRAASVELVIVGWDEVAVALADEQPGGSFGGRSGGWRRSCASFDETVFRAGFLGDVVDRGTTALVVGVWDFPANAFTD